MIRGLPHKMAHLVIEERRPTDPVLRARSDAHALANQTCTTTEPIHPLWAGLTKLRGLRREGYAGILFELRTTDGAPVNVGYICRAHIRDEATEVLGGTPPHKPSSSGRVDTHAGQYFPHVYDLEWVAL